MMKKTFASILISSFLLSSSPSRGAEVQAAVNGMMPIIILYGVGYVVFSPLIIIYKLSKEVGKAVVPPVAHGANQLAHKVSNKVHKIGHSLTNAHSDTFDEVRTTAKAPFIRAAYQQLLKDFFSEMQKPIQTPKHWVPIWNMVNLDRKSDLSLIIGVMHAEIKQNYMKEFNILTSKDLSELDDDYKCLFEVVNILIANEEIIAQASQGILPDKETEQIKEIKQNLKFIDSANIETLQKFKQYLEEVNKIDA